MDSETLRIGRERLSRVFQYLEVLNQHRNPPKRRFVSSCGLCGLMEHEGERQRRYKTDVRPDTSETIEDEESPVKSRVSANPLK